MRSNSTTFVSVAQLLSLRDDTTEYTFSTGHTFTLDPGSEIFFLKGSPLYIYEEKTGPKLGMIIEEVGSLEALEGRLSYYKNPKTGSYDFELYRRRDDGLIQVQPAGSVPSGTTEVKITFNAGASDGIVIVGTIDIGGDDKPAKKK